jgi:multiple antibiotic resistance protein
VSFFEIVKAEAVLLIQSILALYIVVNPSGVASVFLGLTRDADIHRRRSIAFRAFLTGGLVLCAFAIAGSYLFSLFKITAASLQIAGGVFVFGVAFALARGKEGEFFGKLDAADAAAAPGSVAYYPLGVPLIAGPASILVVMTLSAKTTGPKAWVMLVIAIAAVSFLCLLSMLRYVKLEARLGRGLALILPRIMGLVLAVIAVQFIIEGIEAVLPRLVAAAKG